MSMRRRMIGESKQGDQYPFYSDYPTITEYGTYIFDSQSDSTKFTNTFLKMDNTPYNYAGGGNMNDDFAVVYTKEKLTIYNDTVMKTPWITRVQESSTFSLKRCDGSEKDPPLVTFKIDKKS